MSLKIYYDEEIKKDPDFLLDVDSWFSSVKISDRSFAEKVVKQIDNGVYRDALGYEDRFGYSLRLDNLSTSSKALMLLNENKYKIINLEECGVNIGELLLDIKDGFVYIPWDILWVYEWGNDKKIDVLLGNLKCNSMWELYEGVRSL